MRVLNLRAHMLHMPTVRVRVMAQLNPDAAAITRPVNRLLTLLRQMRDVMSVAKPVRRVRLVLSKVQMTVPRHRAVCVPVIHMRRQRVCRHAVLVHLGTLSVARRRPITMQNLIAVLLVRRVPVW